MNAAYRVLTHLARAHRGVLKSEQDVIKKPASEFKGIQDNSQTVFTPHELMQAVQVRRELMQATRVRNELSRVLKEQHERQERIDEIKQDVLFLMKHIDSLRTTISPEQLRSVEQLVMRIQERIKEKEKKMEKT